jgi:hypothetical protein
MITPPSGFARHCNDRVNKRDLCHHSRVKRTDGTLLSMASAEHLLHEAQYAFQSTSFGESRENARNRSRATSLCKKIIRKFPTSMEAAQAHALLKRLGEEAYSSKMKSQHRHEPQITHHRKPTSAPNPEMETFNWAGLFGWLFMLPKVVLAMIVFAGFFLFGFLGPFLFVPLVAFVLLTGPFRQMLKPEQRREMNAFVARANAFIEEQRQ